MSLDASSQETLLSSLKSKNLNDFVEHIKDSTIDVNFLYDAPDNGTLLDIACRSPGYSKFIEILLQHGADINRKNDAYSGKTPLLESVQNADPETWHVLLNDERCDTDVEDNQNNSAVHYAAKYNKLEFIKLLRRRDYVYLDGRNEYGDTPLYVALTEGSADVIRELLNAPDVDLDSPNKSTRRTCRDLIEQKYPQYQAQLHQELVNNPEGKLFRLLQSGNTEQFIKLAKQLARVDRNYLNRNNGECTYLQYACDRGYTDVVSALLHLGIDPNERCVNSPYRSWSEYTPLMKAVEQSYPDMVLELIRNPKVSFEPVAGFTILHTAFHRMVPNCGISIAYSERHDYRKTLKYILQYVPPEKLDVNWPDKRGDSALHYAVQLKDPVVIKDLLRAGAYFGQKNNKGEIPLTQMDPRLLEEYLDGFISTDGHPPMKEDAEIIIDLKPLMPPNSPYFQATSEATKKHLLRIGNTAPEAEPLLMMSHEPELRHLLAHPALACFLTLKWNLIKIFFYIDLLLRVTFCCTFTSFIYRVHNSFPDEALRQSTNDAHVSKIDTFLWLLSVLQHGILLSKDFFYFYTSPRHLKTPENWFRALSVISTGILLIFRTSSSLAMLLVLIFHLQMIFFLGNHPRLSVTIHVLKTTLLSFCKISSWSFVLILSVTFGIKLLFKNHPDIIYVFLKDPMTCFAKSISAMINIADSEYIPTPSEFTAAQGSFIVFVFLSTMVFCNLFLVSAIAAATLTPLHAQLLRLESRVKYISYVESLVSHVPSSVYNFFDNILAIYLPEKRPKIAEVLQKKISFFSSATKIRLTTDGTVELLPPSFVDSQNRDFHFLGHSSAKVAHSVVEDAVKILENSK